MSDVCRSFIVKKKETKEEHTQQVCRIVGSTQSNGQININNIVRYNEKIINNENSRINLHVSIKQ